MRVCADGHEGGDDDVPEENLEETARTQFGEEDMEDELDDDRDFRVHLHGRDAWITLDGFKAAFEEDTHGGTAGRIVALVDPNSEWFMHKSKTERHMSWKWQKEATLEGEQTDGQEEASDGNAEDAANANGDEAENPVGPGRWELCQSRWEGRKILFFPAAADDDDATTIAAPVDGQEDTSATAAGEVRDGENGGQDGTDGANDSGVPRLTFSDADAGADLERDAYDRLVMITIFNDAAPKGDIPQSKTRLWVRRLSLDNLTHVDTILSSVTSNVASAIFKVPAIESGEKGVAYEFDVDAPAGFVINVSTRLEHSILDAYSPNVQASLLSRNVISREGSFPAVLEDQWQILQSWSFKVEGQSSGEEEEEEANSAPEPRELMLGCNLHIFDPMVAPHVRVCIVNRDTHEWRYFPTLEVPWQKFVSNTSGYSVLLVAHCRRGNLPSSSWRMDFFASSSLAFSGDEVGSDEAAAESVLIAEAQAATITDYRDKYIPNRYWRLMRDVVGVPEDESCETIALRLTVSDSTAVVRLAAYAEASGEEIVSIQGRGEMSLLDVPTKVMVKPKATQGQKENGQQQDEDGGAEEEEEEQMVESQVIIDAQLQPSSWDAPPELSSVRPYHYPKRQPGDAVPSALQWDLRIVGAASIGLARDRAVELKEDAIRQDWEEAQEGRAAMAASHREHILYTAQSRTATQAEGVDASGEGKNEGGAVAEEGSAEIPDGLEGLDEEEREKELARRKDFASVKDKLPCVPHINPKTIKYRRVKRLGKLTAEVEEANAAAVERANEMLQGMEQKRADEKMQWEARGKKVESDMLSRRQASMERFSSLWAARSSK